MTNSNTNTNLKSFNQLSETEKEHFLWLYDLRSKFYNEGNDKMYNKVDQDIKKLLKKD